MTSAIFAEGLVKAYPGGVRALDGLGLQVEAGTVFGLLGPNGAGKSTTVRVLTTLSRPHAGAARVAGLDVQQEPERDRAAIGASILTTGFSSAAYRVRLAAIAASRSARACCNWRCNSTMRASAAVDISGEVGVAGCSAAAPRVVASQ